MAGSPGAAPGPGPNIVLIVADDQGAADCSVNPHRAGIHTPNLSRLAAGGVRFTQAYASASMCTPSRVGMLSGRGPARFGVYDVGGDSTFTWPRAQRLLPQYLKDMGYATGCIGKWHCGGEIEEWAYNHPLERGFDRFWGFMGSTHDYWRVEPGSGFNGAGYQGCGYHPIYDQREPVESIDYLTDDITREAVAFIDAHHAEPFFLYVPHHAPHVPLQCPRETYETYGPLGLGSATTATRAMYEHLDAGVGAILDRLEHHGLTDNTLVIYTSDNGGGERSGQLNDPHRGGKFTLLEGGLRVPLIMRWPDRIPADRVYGAAVSNIDFLPTILAAVGAAPRGPVDGVNLLPHLRGEAATPPHDALCWKMPEHTGEYAIRAGDWKLVETSVGRGLFNLREDPAETRDLRGERPEIAARLAEAYAAWDRDNRPSLWTPEHHRRYSARRTSPNPLENAAYHYSPRFGPAE